MLNIPLIILSVVDFAGAILHVWPMPGNFMIAISIILMVKGAWSIVSSLSHGFYLDFLGGIDFLAGLVLIVVNFGTPLSFGWMLGLVLGLKATYSIFSSFRI